jgi:hypothetical protein
MNELSGAGVALAGENESFPSPTALPSALFLGRLSFLPDCCEIRRFMPLAISRSRSRVASW